MTTITIPNGQVLKGAFLNTGALQIDGPGKFDPSLYVDSGGTTVVNADVIGKGTFLSNDLTFGGSVGSHVTVDLTPFASRLTIDHPTQFKGAVGEVQPTQPFVGPTGLEIDLVGLANADGYSFKNDILKITDHGKTVDTLHLASSFPAVFTVAEVQGSVFVLTGEFTGVASGGTVLPQHP